MQFANDPWWIAMMVCLVAMILVTLYGLRVYVRDLLILAIALPQALFKKVFGDPPAH